MLDVNPFVTAKVLGGPDPAPSAGWRYGVERPQFGANVRWGVTNNLLLNGTYRPDFAEVETDATQLILDPRTAVQYPEKRPFFLDGLEQFTTPNNLIYTRKIEAPVGAAKLTGKVGDISLAYLGASDDEGSVAAGGGGHPLFNIFRLRHDFAQGSQVGVALTDKEQGGSFNRMASVDSRIAFDGIYSVFLQGAGSNTRTPSIDGAGPLWQAEFTRGGRSFVMDYNLSAIDPEFVAASGFISRDLALSTAPWTIDTRSIPGAPSSRPWASTFEGTIHGSTDTSRRGTRPKIDASSSARSRRWPVAGSSWVASTSSRSGTIHPCTPTTTSATPGRVAPHTRRSPAHRSSPTRTTSSSSRHRVLSIRLHAAPTRRAR